MVKSSGLILRANRDMLRCLLKASSVIAIIFVLLATLSWSCRPEPSFKLPGQERVASEKMVRAIEYVQNQLGKPIKFYGMSDSSPSVGRGAASWRGSEVSISVNTGLDYEYAEAVVAHELAHILQNIQGYYGIEVEMNEQGQPIFPQFGRMAESINSLVLDLGADNWASGRGFKVEDGLKNDFLPRALKSVELLKESGYVESFDWEDYYGSLAKLARAVTTGEQVQVSFSSEFATQRNAVAYAKWKLRLSPYGLFSHLDDEFKRNFPGTWQLGNEIYAIVNEYGISDRDSSNKTIVKVLEYLHLPYPLFKVRDISTGNIVLQ